MGTCCNKNPPYKSPATDSNPPMPEDRAPPIPIEEETIKEVLSETAKHSIAKIRDESESKAEAKIETEEKRHPWIYINEGDVASDFSKICSLSKSISATTTTAEMMKVEYEDEVGMWFKDNISLYKFQRGRRLLPSSWMATAMSGWPMTEEEGGEGGGWRAFWSQEIFYKGMEWPFICLPSGMAIPLHKGMVIPEVMVIPPLFCEPNAIIIIPLEGPFHSVLHYSEPNATLGSHNNIAEAKQICELCRR